MLPATHIFVADNITWNEESLTNVPRDQVRENNVLNDEKVSRDLLSSRQSRGTYFWNKIVDYYCLENLSYYLTYYQ